MKWIANLSRILTGVVFVFSGFVKGVDPLGTAYRLEDYFIAFHWDFFIPYALFFSILLCTMEFTIGIMLLFKLRMKIAAWLLLMVMVFFTGLTLNDAINNPVPDCGCFGDAIKLTNWQTFYKNLFLLPLSILIFYYRNKFTSSFNSFRQSVFTLIPIIAFAVFSYLCYAHLPVVDFTEWKTGRKLYLENPKPVEYFVTYKNKKSGATKEYLSPNFPYNDSIWIEEWQFVSQRVVDPNKVFGKSLLIFDESGDNVTENIIRNPGYQLVVNSYDLTKANSNAFQKINSLASEASNDGISTSVLVSAEKEVIQNFKEVNKLQLDFYIADDIILKTIVRSNPGLMLMKDGVILKKWHYNDLPDYKELEKTFSKRK